LSTTTSQALLPAANLSIPEPNSLQQVETILKPKRSAPRKWLHRTEWRTFFTPNTQLYLILATMMVKIAQLSHAQFYSFSFAKGLFTPSELLTLKPNLVGRS
jgi:hypothetical protein